MNDRLSEREGGKAAWILENVHVVDYRNYTEVCVDFAPGMNAVVGPNAQGKTNLLEAIYLLATGRVLRGQRDAEAIREGAETAIVQGRLACGTLLEIRLALGARKVARLNGATLPRASDLMGRLPAVAFSTVDLAIVRGEPSDRRLFLDVELCQIYPAYLTHLAAYKRALEQRNALLKREWNSDDAEYEAWEEPMAFHGAALRAHRERFLLDLAPLATAEYARLGAGETWSCVFEPRDEGSDATSLRRLLAASRDEDRRRGHTQIGPHRDDFGVALEGRDARRYASQGQQRAAIIALKLGVLAHASGILGAPPLLLLDDVFSDLDAGRRRRLTEALHERAGQVVLTCTEEEMLGEAFPNRTRVLRTLMGGIDTK
jgi:DNA replication and repair protein RecF